MFNKLANAVADQVIIKLAQLQEYQRQLQLQQEQMEKAAALQYLPEYQQQMTKKAAQREFLKLLKQAGALDKIKEYGKKGLNKAKEYAGKAKNKINQGTEAAKNYVNTARGAGNNAEALTGALSQLQAQPNVSPEIASLLGQANQSKDALIQGLQNQKMLAGLGAGLGAGALGLGAGYGLGAMSD